MGSSLLHLGHTQTAADGHARDDEDYENDDFQDDEEEDDDDNDNRDENGNDCSVGEHVIDLIALLIMVNDGDLFLCLILCIND